MKLDNSAAWKEAMASLSANREVMAAIGGVFFLLPSLALGLFVAQPEPKPNITPEQAMKLMTDFYAAAAPFLILMVLLQAVGMLAILTLCTDTTRPTVGEAIKRGIAGFLPYVGSSLIMGLGVSVAGGLVGIASAAGLAAVAGLLVIVLIVAIAFAAIRFSLAAPVVAVERLRNPFNVLTRSWALTRGNAGRIAWLMFLIFIVFMVIVMAVSAVSGVFSALLLGAGAAKTIEAVVSSFMSAGFTVVFTALLAAIHRQLSGNTPGAIATTFD
jgi:hypothetical protein